MKNGAINLLFEIGFNGITYAAVNSDNDIVYDGFCPVTEWTAKQVKTAFATHILGKLRGHGKVFNAVGIVVPFAPLAHSKPEPATPALLKQLMHTASQKMANEPVGFLLQSSTSAWPHLPHYFLYDTHLSSLMSREAMVPPFTYDLNKKLQLHPMLLHSYGHRANMLIAPASKSAISLYIGNQVSVAVLEGEKVLDASISYSPISSTMGYYGSGALDVGFLHDVMTRSKFNLEQFVYHQSGLNPMTEMLYPIDVLLEIAGLIPRKGSVDLNEFAIETIEWVELSVKSFIRSLRHSLGAMAVHPSSPNTLIINTSVIPQSSELWPLLIQGILSHVKMVPSSTSLLQAANSDLSGAC